MQHKLPVSDLELRRDTISVLKLQFASNFVSISPKVMFLIDDSIKVFKSVGWNVKIEGV